MTRHVLAALLLLNGVAFAHDAMRASDWIGEHQYKVPNAGGNCCGQNDCGVIDKDAVRYSKDGLEVKGEVRVFVTTSVGIGWQAYQVDEIVPYGEVQPSEDQQFWRCAWPTQQQRKCFFGPPPGS